MVVAVTPSGGTLTALVGLLTLRLTVDGSFQRYVRVGMKPWLLIAGTALLVLGLVTLVRALGSSSPEPRAEHGHVHRHGVGVGWLLLAPMATLLLVAPPAWAASVSTGPCRYASRPAGPCSRRWTPQRAKSP